MPFGEAFRFWVRLGFINFGGPAGQIALMHRELVERRGWIGEGAFLRGLNFCTLLPGPEATQLAAYIGWRLHGTLGGIVAGAFFVIPSIVVLLALSWMAVAYGEVPWVSGLLYGVQPVVVAVVIEAILRIGRRTLHHPLLVAFALASFVAIAILRLSFPLVVLGAGLAGTLLQRPFPQVFQARGQHGTAESALATEPENVDPSLGRVLRVLAICFVLWAVPVGALWLWRGSGDVLVQEALFFTQAAFVTFGGAYAVLAYIADQAVNVYGWLEPGQMVQGLGLAESTPGPLIMVTQYVGFVGAWRHAGAYPPLLNAVLGALITTYVTFLPSFLFIFVGAPFIEALGRSRRIGAALVGVTAAVVGVIANLALFFGGQVLLPGWRPDPFAWALALGSFVALVRFHAPVYFVVPAGALLGMLWRVLAFG